MHCIVNMMHQHHQTQNTRIDLVSIFVSAALHFTNHFSEFYHNTVNAMQAFFPLPLISDIIFSWFIVQMADCLSHGYTILNHI